MPVFINKRADRLVGDQTSQLLMNKYILTAVFLLTCGTVRRAVETTLSSINKLPAVVW